MQVKLTWYADFKYKYRVFTMAYCNKNLITLIARVFMSTQVTRSKLP